MTWLMANWNTVVLAIIAIDAAILPLFPDSGLLVAIKKALSGFAPKA